MISSSPSGPRTPSRVYSRTFSALAAGAFLVVSGLIGWNVSYLRGWFQGGQWQDGPVWWQLGLGLALLVVGVRWLRRLLRDEWQVQQEPPRATKSVGRGRTRRRLPGA